MEPAPRDDYLIGVRIDDQVGVVGDDDDLPAQPGASKALDQLVEDRLGIEFSSGWSMIRGRSSSRSITMPRVPGDNCSISTSSILDAVGDLDVVGAVKPRGDAAAPFSEGRDVPRSTGVWAISSDSWASRNLAIASATSALDPRSQAGSNSAFAASNRAPRPLNGPILRRSSSSPPCCPSRDIDRTANGERELAQGSFLGLEPRLQRLIER
jgi:hypothetical protein